MSTFVIVGARNLGGAVADQLLSDGWSGAVIARSDTTLDALRARGAVALRADAADPSSFASGLRHARGELGRIDVLVNAVSVARFDPNVPWGGGPLAEADLARFEAWSAAVTRQAFVLLSEAARTLEAPAAVIQVANSATRTASPGLGLWAAGWHGVRALTTAAAAELGQRGIDVTLFVVDGPIASPKTQKMVAGLPPEAVHRQQDVATAIAALAAAEARPGEVVLTPRATAQPV